PWCRYPDTSRSDTARSPSPSPENEEARGQLHGLHCIFLTSTLYPLPSPSPRIHLHQLPPRLRHPFQVPLRLLALLKPLLPLHLERALPAPLAPPPALHVERRTIAPPALDHPMLELLVLIARI